jgi:tRNA 2-thiouridine synthesizing protein B
MLHLISQSPIETAILERIDSGDVVIFLENALLRILKTGSLSKALTLLLDRSRLCVLGDDLMTRGIRPEELVHGIEVIDYAEFVELTVINRLIQSWS